MYLLDGNVISELRPGRARMSESVAAWARTVSAADQYIAAITVLELERGVQRLERRAPADAVPLRRWLDAVLDHFAPRTVAFTGAVARRCAAMRLPDPAPETEAMIAATALEHGLIVVTRNARDFARLGVRWLNPWEPSSTS